MSWPWRRRKPAEPATAARHAMPRQASWAQPAFPPAPAEPPQVRLGFSDGTEVALDERDPSALALRAVAELLVQNRSD